jgi:hypothetical protein
MGYAPVQHKRFYRYDIMNKEGQNKTLSEDDDYWDHFLFFFSFKVGQKQLL